MVKLCKFIMPIINIIKKEKRKKYNEQIKNIIDIHDICSYLMNICCERFFKLSQDEYFEIKKFINNNMDIIESMLAPMNDYFDSFKKYYSHYYCACYYHHKKKLYIFFLKIDIKNFMKKL